MCIMQTKKLELDEWTLFTEFADHTGLHVQYTMYNIRLTMSVLMCILEHRKRFTFQTHLDQGLHTTYMYGYVNLQVFSLVDFISDYHLLHV